MLASSGAPRTMGLNVLSTVRKFIHHISHGRKGNVTTQGLSSTAGGHFLSPFKYCPHTSVPMSWDLSERRERGVRWGQCGRMLCACVLLRVTAVSTLGHLQPLTGLPPVSRMWPWAQVCTLAMHKKQRYQKHTEYTEYLTVGVFLLRKPSLMQIKAGLITTLTICLEACFFLARSPMKTVINEPASLA